MRRTTSLVSRRQFVAFAGVAASARPLPPQTPKICIFSKHLQWLPVPEAAALAAEIGFDGVDLTVRPGGHVEPARAALDLPPAVAAIRTAGLETPMITTGIVTARSPDAEQVLRTAASLGIRRYRWGGLSLDWRRSIPEQIAGGRTAAGELAALNRRCGVCAMYHTHSGTGVLGASIWDLYLLLKDFDPQAVGVNYDIGHATVEGGLGGWQNSASVIAPWMRGVALKDFYWKKNDSGIWQPRWCPIGEGMVNFAGFFRFLRDTRFSGPIQLHFEYPEMGGADSGRRRLTITRAQFSQLARRDLTRVRDLMRGADLGA